MPAGSFGEVAQPDIQQYADMATWGLQLSSSSSSSSVEREPNDGGQSVTATSAAAIALEALAAFSKTTGDSINSSNQDILSTASAQIVNLLTSQSAVGEFGLLPRLALPRIAEKIGAIAALQLAVRPQHAQHACGALESYHLNSLAFEFSAWEGGVEFTCSPAALNVAENVLEGLTAAAAAAAATGVSVDEKSLAVLKLSTAVVAKAAGNVNIAQKMLVSAEESSEVSSLPASLLVDLATATTSSAAVVSPTELVQLYQKATQPPSSEAQLFTKNASICWQYAQYLQQYSSPENEGLAQLTAAAQALSLASSSSPSPSSSSPLDLTVLPIVLFIHRTLVDMSDDVISTHEEAILSSLDLVPSSSWLRLIPQLISLLSTSPVPAVQRIASHLLLKTATHVSEEGDPTCVLLPAMVELQRPPPTAAAPSNQTSSRLQPLVNTLRALNTSLSEDLSQFIQSLSSLALLEDERWHAVLLEAQGTLTKRLAVAYAYLKTIRPAKDTSSSSSSSLPSSSDVVGVSGIDAFEEAVAEEVSCAVAPVLAALRCHITAAENTTTAAGLLEVTPHEQQFREKMNLFPRLHWMLEQLELPAKLAAGSEKTTAPAVGALEAALQRPLQVIKKIASEVAAAGMKVTELELKDVCPALASLTGNGRSRIRVPQGLGNLNIAVSSSYGSPFIGAIESEVKVLHTKTRPKKITLRGTDGVTYSFLVKGREDLHVDLAVSTFFAAADAALSAGSKRSRSPAVMPLTVVPVGPQAGLVGWVERTKPLYEVYASYEAQRAQRAVWLTAATLAQTPSSAGVTPNVSSLQQQSKKNQRGGKHSSKEGSELTKTQIKKLKKAEKEAAAAAAATAAAAAEAAKAALDTAKQPMRPADLFRSKIKAAGVNTSSPRSSWPLDALKSVFTDLSSTAPHQMIANELLYSAAGAAHWWSRQHHYTTSTAVMSIFGHLLGLGDRHLDNVLLQSDTGMVLHVDFGVLFDRGIALHVPEVVPFRLTQSFVSGLGVMGVEGKFRKEAEAALVAVRNNRQALRMLLQSFVEDPLISWAPEVAVKSTRRAYERCAELTHFTRSMDIFEKENEENEEGVAAVAVKEASAVLERLCTDLAPFCSVFSKAEKALDTVSDYQQQLERCTRIIEDSEVEDVALQNTLTTTAAEIENLQHQLDSAVHAVSLLEASDPSFSNTVDSTTITSPYAGVLAAVLDGHLAGALHSAVPSWEPSLAAVPLGMVQSYSAPELTLVNVALGVDPSSVPLTASLLLKAATVDGAGKEALSKVRRKKERKKKRENGVIWKPSYVAIVYYWVI